MKKIVLASLIAALVAGVVLAGETFHRVVVPAGEGGPHVKTFMKFAAPFIKELDLTEEQKTAARQLHEDVMDRIEPLMEQHRAQMEEIHGLLDADNANATQIGQKMIAAHAIHEQMKAAHDEVHEKFVALLTEEQRAKLEKLEAEHPKRRMIHHSF
jgi:Spy/CpxP family protein refolding chaperone